MHKSRTLAALGLVFLIWVLPAQAKKPAVTQLSEHLEMRLFTGKHGRIDFYAIEGTQVHYIGTTPYESTKSYIPRMFGSELVHRYHAISDDGKNLLYIHSASRAGKKSKKPQGLYLFSHGEEQRLLRRGDELFMPWTNWPKQLPKNVIAYTIRPTAMPMVATTEGEDFPLALLGAGELHRAAYEGRVEAIDTLLEQGEPINALTYWGFTAAEVATVQGHEDAAVRLLERGADPNAGSAAWPASRGGGVGLASLATGYERFKVVEGILAQGFDLSSSESVVLPLHIAVSPNKLPRGTSYGTSLIFGESFHIPNESIPALVKRLLDYGADPNAVGGIKGRTAIHVAVSSIRTQGPPVPEIVQILIESGADPNVRDQLGNTPLHIVGFPVERYKTEWEQECLPVLQILVSQISDIDVRNTEGLTPLQTAVQANRMRTARFLIENGADDTVEWVPYPLHTTSGSQTVRKRIDKVMKAWQKYKY